MASIITRDHEQIREWAQQRGAQPTIVSRTGGMLRFEFSSESVPALTPVEWDEFFRVFDEKGLDLIIDSKAGSRFHKFVYPETVEAKAEHREAEKPARAAARLHVVSAKPEVKSVGAAKGPKSARTTAAANAKSARRPATTRKTATSAKAKPALKSTRRAS